jgi:dTMP kinase
MTTKNCRFIVLEGIDGAGTTTQARLLAERLRQVGHLVVTTGEPSSGPVGSLIRQALERRLQHDGAPISQFDWATLALLFAADRADHANRCIVPALQSGAYVICDRYDLSSCIYQSVTAPDPQVALSWVQTLNCQVPRPDITVVLDVSPGTAELRRAIRGAAPELFEQTSLQRQLASAYEDAQHFVPNDRLAHLDGEQLVDAVTERLCAVCLG